MSIRTQRRAEALISGRVQGVAYRSYTQDASLALGLSGWVRNLYDGRVQLVAEGEEGQIARLLKWCWTGSPTARVDDVAVTFYPPTGDERGFEIRPTVADPALIRTDDDATRTPRRR